MITRLNFYKNRETSLIVEDVSKSITEHGFLGQCYQKAFDALKNYVEQTKSIREELSNKQLTGSQKSDLLYCSPQNIIAFSGKRGTGKTSTMLSFADSLGKNNSEYKKSVFPNNGVLILNPIDPTMLAKDQDILTVVLSRLLFKSEEYWDNHARFTHTYRNLESEKNEILRKAGACLNGINAIKSGTKIESLSDLQRMGDSAVLKKDYFDLVELVTAFCLGSNNLNYLIIPIDDTDCQIQKAYLVMSMTMTMECAFFPSIRRRIRRKKSTSISGAGWMHMQSVERTTDVSRSAPGEGTTRCVPKQKIPKCSAIKIVSINSGGRLGFG